MRGKVKTKKENGFGFINNGEGKDIFFHMSSLNGVDFEDLQEGDEVEFDSEQGEKGPRAVNVRRA